MADTLVFSHPEYSTDASEWQKWRLAYAGGQQFKDTYLKKYDIREDDPDFLDRKCRTFNPPTTRTEISKLKNCLVQHLAFVQRTGGPESYQEAVVGEYGGVDRSGRTMQDFFSELVIEEFLVMSKVGIYVDMPGDLGETVADNFGKRPYIYHYQREQICNWVPDPENPGMVLSVLLKDRELQYENDLSLPKDRKTLYRHFVLVDGKVQYSIYEDSGLKKQVGTTRILNLPRIPFICLEMPVALMQDTADMQIALLNLASTCVNYCYKANWPVLTEQYDARERSPYLAEGDDNDDDETQPAGPAWSMRYSKTCDRPEFIHPSPEPLKASMEMQAAIKAEIREAISHAVTELDPKAARGLTGSLPGGLASIGSMLQRAEMQIAYFWALYEGQTEEPAVISYPKVYSIQTDEERAATANTLVPLISSVPSLEFRRATAKIIAQTLLAGKVSNDVLEAIADEVSSAICFNSAAKDVEIDLKNGLVTTQWASEHARNYPKGEADKAAEQHLAKVTAIAAAQAKNVGPHTAVAAGEPMDDSDKLAARGVLGTGGDASKEKIGKEQRGEGK